MCLDTLSILILCLTRIKPMNSTSTSTAAYNRAERAINRFVNDRVITPSGRDFLKEALDPFMDVPLKKLSGWPDVETGNSVVRCIKQQTTISAPSSVTPGNNWDCAVVMWPWEKSLSMTTTTGRANNLLTVDLAAATVPHGGVQIYGATSPMSLNTMFTEILDQLVLSDDYTRGVGRLIGMAYEVHNTTADLYKQGAVTSGCIMTQNRSSSTFDIYNGADNSFLTATSGVPMRSPPNTLAELTILPGSKTWEAREGVYAVARFHSAENPPFNTDYVQPYLMEDDTDVTNIDAVTFPRPFPVGSPAYGYASPTAHLHPKHLTVSWFSGLSYSTTLQVNTVHYYETFPYNNENSILVLATPSAEYDPIALEIYSKALSAMPCAVPVHENFQGQWWADVVESISNVLNFIPHPLAQAAALAGKTGATALRAIGNTDEPISTGTPVKRVQAQQKKKAKPLPPIPKKK